MELKNKTKLNLKTNDDANQFGIKPTAFGITPKAPRKEIMYKCTICDLDLSTMGGCNYCDKCGCLLNWDVMRNLNMPFLPDDEKIINEVLNAINFKNNEQ